MSRLLIVDDETALAGMLARVLAERGHEVETAGRVEEAVKRLEASRFDLVITDLRLPDGEGTTVLEAAKAGGDRAPAVVIMTAHATTAGAVELMKAGARDYLIKPFSTDEFLLRLDRLLEARTLADRTRDLERRLARHEGGAAVVARSEAMRRVLEQVDQVAGTDATVLLLGESGTGKTLLARALHERSPRASRPMVEVHCGALPETLLESELFGHEKGAFTGAHEARAGHLEAAKGGTLFLDEIGEVSPAVQVKLLRFLQDRNYVRVGSTQVRTADVRIVAATNRDLPAAIRDGAFREDLYYRLSVFPIVVPPLRERIDDLPGLVERLLAQRGETPGRVSGASLEALSRYGWPGNVRELENVIQRALIASGKGAIEPEILAPMLTGARPAARLDGLLVAGFNLDAFERDLIHHAIEQAKGNKAEAARLLGITRRRLYSRLEILEAKVDES